MARTYTVRRGDTLSGIAKSQLGDANKYRYLAQINGIRNPNLIYVGQVIKLSAGGESSSGGSSGGSSASSSNSNSSSNMAKVIHFGLQANSERTVMATWDWKKSNTAHYKIRWWYKGADNIALLGSETTTEWWFATYNAPDYATTVWFHVMPISAKYTSGGKEYSHWTAEWSTAKYYYFSNNPPKKPPVPNVKIDKYTLTAELSNLDINAKEVQFQVVKDDTTVFNTGTATIKTTSASYSCSVTAGSNYKVRCRGVRDEVYGAWSEYSANAGTPPVPPEHITSCKATSETSVYLAWSEVKNAKTYDIEYTTKRKYFDGTDGTTTQSGIEFNHFEKNGLEPGQEYFFRIRAVNENGPSSWSEIKSVSIGKKPAAPTTWSSTTTAVVGEPLNLYWVHNAADGSSQTFAELEIYIGGIRHSYTIENTRPEEDKDKTSVYSIDTSKYTEGTKIQWRVRTAGVTKTYGDWSVQRTVDIYAPPTLQISMTNANKDVIQTLTSFPFYISALAGPKTQVPVGYQLIVTSNKYYETIDSIGNQTIVNEGDEIFSRYFDISEALLVEMSANNIDLENNIDYTVTCVVTMNSGLTARAKLSFTVAWDEQIYTPNAAINIDNETIVAYIQPYCEIYPVKHYKVDFANGQYIATQEIVPGTEGISIEELTTTGEIVYKSTSSTGEVTYFYLANSKDPELVKDVELSVYRREFDGSFTEIAKHISNSKATYITDPHPALDFARYRIIATALDTGAISYYDMPGYPTNEKSVVIQWDEEWTEFNSTSPDTPEKPPWAGSLLKLPYNIDVSNKNNTDVKFVEYAGRKHPVSYYGTHLGESLSLKVVIDKEDKDTLYAIRRLSVWPKDVYVREPSGCGYWASVSVSYSQSYSNLTIPISIEATRVEGGM